MSETISLYKSYKRKEARAFELLFNHSDWRTWTFRRLSGLAKTKLPFLGRKRDEFASLLESATESRVKISAAFPNAPDVHKAQHRYVVFCYRSILASINGASLQSGASDLDSSHGDLDIRLDEETEGLIPGRTERKSAIENVKDSQDHLFFDILENYVDTILDLWGLAQEDALSISTATTGMLPAPSRLLGLIYL